MKKVQREDIYIISRHSNLTEKGVAKALKDNVYNGKETWEKFLRLLFITLGVGFTAAGIIFFFAYNWADLHKFTKMGIVEGLVIAVTSLVLLPKTNTNIRNVILTGASVLVGVLFAVYGQIYQTGANAYDFFLVWTIFITLWVVISNFAPLWLIYIVLINTVFILYSQQVAKDWSEIYTFTLLFIINTIVLIAATMLSQHKKVANWFLNTVGLVCATYATLGIILGIFEGSYRDYAAFLALITITSVVFAAGIWYGLKTKSGFYISVIPFCITLIISAWLIEIEGGMMMYLCVSLFIVTAVTLIIKNLIHLQKKWKNEK